MCMYQALSTSNFANYSITKGQKSVIIQFKALNIKIRDSYYFVLFCFHVLHKSNTKYKSSSYWKADLHWFVIYMNQLPVRANTTDLSSFGLHSADNLISFQLLYNSKKQHVNLLSGVAELNKYLNQCPLTWYKCIYLHFNSNERSTSAFGINAVSLLADT